MDAGYIVRWLPSQGLGHGLRITIGTEDEVKGVVAALRRWWSRGEGGLMLPFARITIIGLGLIGSSVARAVRKAMPTARITAYDADPAVRETVRALDLADDVADTAGQA